MPRVYKRIPGSRKYVDYSEETLNKAINKYKNGMGTLKEVGEEYGIPYVTLYRKCKNLHSKNYGGQTVLSSSVENAIVKAILYASEWGYPFEGDDVRILVQNYLNRTGTRISTFKDNFPGRDWFQSFLNRHKIELAVRMSQSIKESRAKINRTTINLYFDNLGETLGNIPPESIVNYDETNFTDDPGRKKVVVRRTSKRAEKIMDSSKAATSVIFACSASGVLLPPYIVYKADHLWSTWTENGPDKARYNRSASGWFDMNLFEDWFLSICLPYFKNLLPGPKVLFGDNLASHLSVNVIKECEQNNIRFVLLPPNSTHLTQPLDVSVFRPIKNAWRKVLQAWKRQNKGVVRKDIFPKLLKQVLINIGAKSQKNIQSGFEATGIVLLNREKVLKKLPVEEEEDNNQIQKEVSESLREIFQQTRYGQQGPSTSGRRKKLNVEPGKSVSYESIRDNGEEKVADTKIKQKCKNAEAKKKRKRKY